MKQKPKPFPREVFVQAYLGGDIEYLVVDDSPELAAERDCGANETGERIAVYRLERIVRVTRNYSVVPVEEKRRRGR